MYFIFTLIIALNNLSEYCSLYFTLFRYCFCICHLLAALVSCIFLVVLLLSVVVLRYSCSFAMWLLIVFILAAVSARCLCDCPLSVSSGDTAVPLAGFVPITLSLSADYLFYSVEHYNASIPQTHSDGHSNTQRIKPPHRTQKAAFRYMLKT